MTKLAKDPITAITSNSSPRVEVVKTGGKPEVKVITNIKSTNSPTQAQMRAAKHFWSKIFSLAKDEVKGEHRRNQTSKNNEATDANW